MLDPAAVLETTTVITLVEKRKMRLMEVILKVEYLAGRTRVDIAHHV